MSERWREPLKIATIEHDPSEDVHIGGRRYMNADVTLADRDQFERLRDGYVCIECHEPHEVPFPVRCTLCGFQMRKEQRARLEQGFKGEKWIGPQESYQDELDALAERSKRTKSGIYLPRSL